MQSKAFTKLFASITDSSIWSEDDATRIVWITLLAMADSSGYVGASIPGLAARARKTIPEVERALEKFHAPDPYSRTRDYDGRRIMTVDGGWLLLNYEKHRAVADAEAYRARKREWAAKNRMVQATVAAPGDSRLLAAKVADVSASASVISACDQDPDLPYKLGIRERARAVEEACEAFDAVSVVDPRRGRFAPEDFKPTDAHRVRCTECKLDIDTLLREFKAFEFNRAYTDWDRRFSRWIERARVDAETERANANSGAAKGPRNAPARSARNPHGWQPNAKHGAFARRHNIDLQHYAAAYIDAGQLLKLAVLEADDDFGKRLVLVARGKPFGLGVAA